MDAATTSADNLALAVIPTQKADIPTQEAILSSLDTALDFEVHRDTAWSEFRRMLVEVRLHDEESYKAVRDAVKGRIKEWCVARLRKELEPVKSITDDEHSEAMEPPQPDKKAVAALVKDIWRPTNDHMNSE